MKKFNKLEDKEVVFINQSWTEEERKKFSEFLKDRKKTEHSKEKKAKKTLRVKRRYAQ